MARTSIAKADWPRRRAGVRRRATARQALVKPPMARPTGWLGRIFMLVLITVPALILSSPAYATYASSLPDVTQVTSPIPSDTIIYASDGTYVLADLHPPGYQHYPEQLSAMGTLLPAAIIAIEERHYYQEPGVDPLGIARAAIVDWRAQGGVQGASTITQQLVKIRLVGSKPTIDRK